MCIPGSSHCPTFSHCPQILPISEVSSSILSLHPSSQTELYCSHTQPSPEHKQKYILLSRIHSVSQRLKWQSQSLNVFERSSLHTYYGCEAWCSCGIPHSVCGGGGGCLSFVCCWYLYSPNGLPQVELVL